MSKQLFGTDGVRGVAGEYPLDPVTTHALGRALGEWAAVHSGNPEVLIGMDTRESGPWLASQVAGGLAEAGVTPRFAGLITTPGVAYLTRTGDFVAGVMISASHNPYQDNGLKIFDRSGFKVPDTEELCLEEEILALRDSMPDLPKVELVIDEGLDRTYLDFLLSTVRLRLNGRRIAVDCANGAASELALFMLRSLGAEVLAIACEPNGRNINLNCGALYVENLREHVLRTAADYGVAFDGDADRAILVSHSGKTIDGDSVLLIAGQSLARQNRLTGHTVVATVMSNLGLERALRSHGIRMLRTPVGDKYVLEEMERRGAVLGGEQSGHVIFREYATTGDGLLTALRVLEIAEESGHNLDELTSSLQIYPQRLINVKVKQRRPLDELTDVQREIRRCEQSCGDAGRVLVRFSGTEPLAR